MKWQFFPPTVWVLVGILAGSGAVQIAPANGEHPRSPRRAERMTFASESTLAEAGLQYYWTRELNLDVSERIDRFYSKDENLYFLTSNNRLRAVDAAVGNPKWFVRVGQYQNRIFEPTHVNKMRLPERIGTVEDITAPQSVADAETFDAMIVNSMTQLLVVNRATGKVYRDVRFDGYIATDAGVSDGTFFYVATGEKMYSALKLMPNVNVWSTELEQIVTAPLAYFDRKLFLGTTQGVLRCAAADNYGEKRWEQTLDGTIPSRFHVDSRGVFLACNDKRIYAFGLLDGKKLWEPVVVQGIVGGPTLVGERTLFQYIVGDGLYAIDPTNGRVRWKRPQGRGVLALMDGQVYVLETDETLCVVDEITGQEVHRVPFGGFDLYAENLTAPAIYAATREGRVFCIRKNQAGRLTADMLTK